MVKLQKCDLTMLFLSFCRISVKYLLNSLSITVNLSNIYG